MATPDQKSPNVLLQNLCCRILGRSEADVAQQFQYAVRVIGSNFAPTVERDEFLVAEKIKKELTRQRREADAALFSELHRKLHSQGVLKNKWSILYLLLSLSEDPRKQPNKVSSYATLFAQALPRDAHSTPYYYARPQTLPLNYQDRSVPPAQSSGSLGSSGVSSIGVCALSGPTPTPQPLLPGQSHPAPGVGDCLRQQLSSRLAWTLTANQPSLQTTTSKGVPSAVSRNVTRPRREGDAGGAVEVAEAALVRDILYVFQGIDGRNVKMSNADNCYKVEGKANLNKSLRDTTVRLAELGWLHNKIRKYTDQRSLDRSFGLVGQSFCAALHQELREYYRLLSVLHSQLQLEDDQGVNLGLESSLTLRRLLVWTYDPKIRLKTLAALVDHCQGRKGGELASAVHAYTKTGDPSMRSLVQHILSLVSHPVLSFLYRWIYDGELEDTYHEFFVASDPTVKTDRLWHDKYTLRKSMIPSFMTMDQSRKVLLIGKSINFLHQVCHDQTPTTKMIAVTKSAESPQDEFSGVLHHCHILASEMVHFIHQMQYYITFEVLECSWDELWNKVQQAQDLDHIIAAHEAFLDTVISRCLLDADSRALLNQLRAVFDQIIELQNTQDAIYRAALEELQRRLQFEEKKQQRGAEGQWGVTAAEEEQESQRVREFQESIPRLCSQLRILTHFYQGIVQQFLVLLTTSPDESLRFLSFRLDFNEHYRAREPRLRVSLGARGRRSSHT
ncbi:gamma-tubulin complex component 3 isoform X6 [Lagenorhynchus albirostris]|uniref:gamma-tubulin complex component 3 isoform X6 n=1 Tax=Lagenorhynchus albirostris TaxID=27610 RepID=UPI0028EFE88B|nr:gamma-tubulin complex component 3 isoform X6 [Lagenorhynchus albirostris]